MPAQVSKTITSDPGSKTLTNTWDTGNNRLDNYEYYIGKWKAQFTIGPSGVRALPLDAGTKEGGHYFRYFCQAQPKLKLQLG